MTDIFRTAEMTYRQETLAASMRAATAGHRPFRRDRHGHRFPVRPLPGGRSAAGARPVQPVPVVPEQRRSTETAGERPQRGVSRAA